MPNSHHFHHYHAKPTTFSSSFLKKHHYRPFLTIYNNTLGGNPMNVRKLLTKQNQTREDNFIFLCVQLEEFHTQPAAFQSLAATTKIHTIPSPFSPAIKRSESFKFTKRQLRDLICGCLHSDLTFHRPRHCSIVARFGATIKKTASAFLERFTPRFVLLDTHRWPVLMRQLEQKNEAYLVEFKTAWVSNSFEKSHELTIR
ncbi:hypothetical protein CDAR_577481 [Caerostris darwini]|uniref:Uncharacterized protein n=1 Tax=Caerostris darwini TaxID=1538125 RepID=A0AAV4QDR2_9ARAC|nr:hypothetical protein CDAR_577481 [Caerostris darwini]